MPGCLLILPAKQKDVSRQYYRLKGSFIPGTADTTGEKQLARALQNTDNSLAGEIAVDYLVRIPPQDLGNVDNERFMFEFQKNIKVTNIAYNFLSHLNSQSFAGKLAFVQALSEQPRIHELSIKYIVALNYSEFFKEKKLRFLLNFNEDSTVRGVVNNYIKQLSGGNIYNEHAVLLIAAFTTKSTDVGFSIFYKNSRQVDSVMNDAYLAQSRIGDVIFGEEIKPQLELGKTTGVPPDFNLLASKISKKYNQYYSDWAVINGKMEWCKFQIYENKRRQYWNEYIRNRIKQFEEFRQDTDFTPAGIVTLNNVCYNEIFLHSENKQQLATSIRWMSIVIDKSPKVFEYVDTYADILYKCGNLQEALIWEQRALTLATARKNEFYIKFFTTGIQKMKNHEKIWLEPEYINS